MHRKNLRGACKGQKKFTPRTIPGSLLSIFQTRFMHILIAPNAFKNSLTAEATADAIKEGLVRSNLDCSTDCFPIGDGGDGTGELIIKKCDGVLIETNVHDPLGRTLQTSFGLIEDGRTAVIEMADASGLRLLKQQELNPLKALSYGTGEQVKTALDKGAKKVIVGMGGSATVDGGTGILKALGVRFLNAKGEELTTLPNDLIDLEQIDISGLDTRIQDTEVVVLCDVDNKLLGGNGAAAMFGPQKGASQEDVKKLDAALAKFSEVAFKTTGRNMAEVAYGGTAGGAAAGLYALLCASLVNGIEYFLDLTGFNEALETADLVITGEGSIDEQTLQGKGPYGVAHRAKSKAVPVIGIAGKLPLDKNHKLQEYFDVLLAIGNEPSDLPNALKSTTKNLIRTAHEIGNLLAIKKTRSSSAIMLDGNKIHRR